MGVTFQGDVGSGLRMQVLVDADFASKAADRRSASGGLVMCGDGCVSWCSRTQKCVTFSTKEAEYVAMADVLKEVLFLRQVWRFILPEVGKSLFQYSRILRERNPITNSISKHIDVRHHFITNLVARKGFPLLVCVGVPACRFLD